MGDVLVTRALPSSALDALVDARHTIVRRLDDTPYSSEELRDALADVDGVVCLLTDRFDRAALAAARANRRLKVIANVAVGYDNVDVGAATEAGILVCNTPGVLDETTADLAFALILAASRGTSGAEAVLRRKAWHGWNINDFLGHDVHGKTLGIVGWGRIGRAVARRAVGFDMDVLHHSRRPTGAPGFVEQLDELLRRSDIVSVHVPLNDQTRHLIDGRRLSLMKPTSVLVNTSRGAVVDEEALADALSRNVIFAAGLDVFEHEPAIHPRLLASPRTVLLPHIGSATVATRSKMASIAVGAVVDVLAGRVPSVAVNSPVHEVTGEG